MQPKVLVILNRLVIGGQAFDTIPLLYHLQTRFDILVLYGCKENDETEVTFVIEQFNTLHLKPLIHFKRSFNPVRDLRAFLSIYRTIRSFKPQVVHTHGLKSGALGRVAARVLKVPCIIHTYHGHHFHSYFNAFISWCLVLAERQLAKISTRVVAISNTQKTELAVTYKIAPQQKISVIPLGIDESLFSNQLNNRATFRQAYGLLPKTIAIGIIGRIVPVKNYPLFVKVVAGFLAVTNRDVRFFVIGDGHEKANVQHLLTDNNIAWGEGFSVTNNARVIFTSWLPDVSKALYGLDAVILTSHNEGTPMSIIEAQFCGKPVVATNVGGVKDTFADGESGFLIEADNSGAFIEKLLLLVNDDELRQNMSIKAATFARENFSKAKEIDNFKALYNSCGK